MGTYSKSIITCLIRPLKFQKLRSSNRPYRICQQIMCHCTQSKKQQRMPQRATFTTFSGKGLLLQLWVTPSKLKKNRKSLMSLIIAPQSFHNNHPLITRNIQKQRQIISLTKYYCPVRNKSAH